MNLYVYVFVMNIKTIKNILNVFLYLNKFGPNTLTLYC